MCGTISPEKGQIDAVRAINFARSLGTRIRLDVYGDGNPKDVRDLESVIQELGLTDLIKLKGSTADMRAAYDSTDVAVVCSRNEGFGKVTAEAILTGRPVVAYGAGGTSEILEYGGGLSTPSSPNDLGAALHAVFTQPSLLERLRNEAHGSSLRGMLASSAQRVITCAEELRYA
ncbi:hypothetical protein GCM10009712_41050 [Pseudarthrobacter sulfonivorans]